MTSTIGIQENPETAEKLNRQGMLLVLSSPSGGGKTTISRKLLELEDNVQLSISATTRPKRPSETDGKDYFFVDSQKFQNMADNGEMLEYAKVFGHMYGTPRAPVEAALRQGKDVLFDIDWQGTQQLKEAMPKNIVTIFILPPSWEALAERLKNRADTDPDDVRRRMEKAESEISHYDEYNYIVVNHDIDDSIRRVQAILEAERMYRRRLSGLKDFVEGLRPTG